MRLTLAALVTVGWLCTLPGASGQTAGNELYKIDFDPNEGVQVVGTDETGEKQGLYLRVTFRVRRTGALPAAGAGKYWIVIKEDGKKVGEKLIEEQPDTGLTIVLAVDVRGSNANNDPEDPRKGKTRIEAAQEAARVFFNTLDPKVDCGLILFDDQVRLKREPCQEPERVLQHRAELVKLVQATAPKNGTAYYDAIAQAVQMLKGVKGRKAVVVVTDGVDVYSRTKREEVIRAARAPASRSGRLASANRASASASRPSWPWTRAAA